MKKYLAGLLIGLVLATAGVVVAQNVRDIDNLIMRAFNPYIQYVGTFSFKNAGGTAVWSVDANGAVTARRSLSASAGPAGIQLAAADSGKVYVSTAASGVQHYTLPAASTAGLTYTFIADNAAAEVLIDIQAADSVSLKASEGGANVTTAAGTGIKNTAATNVKGDHITIVSDGTTTWRVTSESGTWASQ